MSEPHDLAVLLCADDDPCIFCLQLAETVRAAGYRRIPAEGTPGTTEQTGGSEDD